MSEIFKKDKEKMKETELKYDKNRMLKYQSDSKVQLERL